MIECVDTASVKTQSNADALAVVVPYTQLCPIPEHGIRYHLFQGGACAKPAEAYWNWGLAPHGGKPATPRGQGR